MDHEPDQRRRATRLIHPDRTASTAFKSFAVPTYRGSTVLFPNMAAAEQPQPGQYRYGIDGTPTARELAERLAAIEGAEQVFLAPSGLAAISLTLLAFTKAGGRVLVPESVYGPTRALLADLLAGFGVAADLYDPLIGEGIAELIRDETQLVWCESPGSITMEIQDIPAIATAAHASDVPVAIDNTYGAGILFDAFAAGADISVQALTKYQNGHSDVLMGSVAVRSSFHAAALGRTQRLLGMAVSPDDCSLVLRGLKTLDLRLRHLGESALQVARWLGRRDEVTAVLHPAFPNCPGHEIWKRDWTGSASVFSVIFGQWTREQVVRFVDALQLFGIGYSWGGANSLAFTYRDLQRPSPELGPLLVRLNIGLEDPADLIADLEEAIAKATA